MGKTKRNKQQQARPAAPAQAQASAPPAGQRAVLDRIDQAAAAAEALAPEVTVLPEPRPDGVDLDAMWTRVHEASERYAAATRHAEEVVQEATLRAEALAAAREQVEARARELAEREQAAGVREQCQDERDLALRAQEQTLQARETEIRARELDAEAEFLALRRSMLAELDRATAGLRDERAAIERAIAEERAAWLAEEAKARAELRAELERERDAHRSALDRERDAVLARLDERRQRIEQQLGEREQLLDERERQLDQERRSVAGERRRLQWDEEEIATQRAELDEQANRRAARKLEEYDHLIQAMTARLEQAQADRDRLDQALRAREDADRRFGQRTPDEVLAELDALRATQGELRAALAARPDADAAERLRQLEAERAEWQSERVELLRRRAELEHRLARADIAAIELEIVRDRKDVLESRCAVLHKAGEELRAEVNALVSRSDGKSPFARCQAMDDDNELQSEISMHEDVGDLSAFVDDLRQRMAGERELFYTERDLRSFLGGLAMSRLILLQGISGTGKTSLPVAFARAMGTRAEIIEVQAGWRDPQDLIGHYNSFDRRFHEKELLGALYRARTPRWRDAIHIVVLDEMNLSHPEQYFSDFLSALEQAPEDQRIVLMPQPVEHAPKLLDDGRILRIPQNVWFVGTANHDETTKGFADKTYDRAHVMELPHHHERFQASRPGPRRPVSFQALGSAFEEAQQHQAGAATRALQFLENTVREPLRRYFGIGWGARLEQQIRRYVPVVVAAGGTVGEATDHLLAMRLVRKLESRHDLRSDYLERLLADIEGAWKKLDFRPEPEQVRAMLRRELRRLGEEREEAA